MLTGLIGEKNLDKGNGEGDRNYAKQKKAQLALVVGDKRKRNASTSSSSDDSSSSTSSTSETSTTTSSGEDDDEEEDDDSSPERLKNEVMKSIKSKREASKKQEEMKR